MAYVVPLGIPHSRFLAWDPDDQDKALAYLRRRGNTCSCGTRPDEWESDRFAYVGQQRYCPGCELLEQERQNVPEGASGVSVYLTKAEYAKTPEQEGIER